MWLDVIATITARSFLCRHLPKYKQSFSWSQSRAYMLSNHYLIIESFTGEGEKKREREKKRPIHINRQYDYVGHSSSISQSKTFSASIHIWWAVYLWMYLFNLICNVLIKSDDDWITKYIKRREMNPVQIDIHPIRRTRIIIFPLQYPNIASFLLTVVRPLFAFSHFPETISSYLLCFVLF